VNVSFLKRPIAYNGWRICEVPLRAFWLASPDIDVVAGYRRYQRHLGGALAKLHIHLLYAPSEARTRER